MLTEADEELALIEDWRKHRRAFRRLCERLDSPLAAIDFLNSHLTVADLWSDLLQLDPSSDGFKRNVQLLARLLRPSAGV